MPLPDLRKLTLRSGQWTCSFPTRPLYRTFNMRSSVVGIWTLGVSLAAGDVDEPCSCAV